jgi:predicted PurR-regulated permease PerM
MKEIVVVKMVVVGRNPASGRGGKRNERSYLFSLSSSILYFFMYFFSKFSTHFLFSLLIFFALQ